MTTPIADYLPTGIHVVIVGAGFGGLTTAIECHLKGHKVTILERSAEWRQLGDIISFGPNAGQILSRYSPTHIADKLKPICMDCQRLKLHTHTGEPILEQTFPPIPGKPVYNGHRAELHKVLYEYALALNIPIRMGQRVMSYHEDPICAWVVLETGEIVKGDIVVASNGLRSKAKKTILQSHRFDIGTGEDRGAKGMWKEKSTGYAVYRAWYDAGEVGLAKDPLTEFLTRKDTHVGWLGHDVHFLVASIKGGKEISWVATHPIIGDAAGLGIDPDDQDGEDWMNPTKGNVEDAVKLFEGWDPVCQAIVSKTPKLIDFPLITRPPLPTFISAHAHLLLLGDSAHPFLPTSIQGASQAMEDGVTLATYLSLSHFSPHHTHLSLPDKTSIAVKSWQKLRYERVKSAQKTGEAVMKTWHRKGDESWEEAKKEPKKMELPREEWLLGHDPEKWARKVWEEIRKEISEGGPEVKRERLAAGPESEEVFEMVKGVDYGSMNGKQ